MSSRLSNLTPRPPNETEKTLLLRYDVLGHLNTFAKWLAVPLAWPIDGSWRDLKRKDVGIVEDEELEELNLRLSIVAPFLPVMVGYKFERPVTAWTPTCTNQSQKHRDLWSSRVEKERELNVGYNPKMPNSLAFPRFLKYRRIGESGKIRHIVYKENMLLFREGGYKVTMRTVNGLQPRWTQLACRHDYAPGSRFCDNGDPSKQLENGMLCSSDVTYLRLDLHEQAKPGGNVSEDSVFSCIFRGVIVRDGDDSRSWRGWSREDKITLNTLTATLSEHILSKPRSSMPSEAAVLRDPPSRGRSQSPNPADVKHDKSDHRSRSKPPARRRSPPPSTPRRPRIEHALSHRRQRMYGFLPH